MPLCHTPPAFGCRGCEKGVRQDWEKKAFQDFKRDHRPRLCKRHGDTMKVYAHTTESGKFFGLVGCGIYSERVGFICEDQDYMVELT